jgi:hypothetical protein
MKSQRRVSPRILLIAALALPLFSCKYGYSIVDMSTLIATPGKFVYYTGETFASKELRVYGIYGDGKTEEIPAGYTLTGEPVSADEEEVVTVGEWSPKSAFTSEGEWSIAVDYNGLQAKFLVKVIPFGTIPATGTDTNTDTDPNGSGLEIVPIFPDR